MATRQGGVYRRENGKKKRVVAPPREQRFGAHAHHPSTPAPQPATKSSAPKGGGKSTPVKETDDADTATGA